MKMAFLPSVEMQLQTLNVVMQINTIFLEFGRLAYANGVCCLLLWLTTNCSSDKLSNHIETVMELSELSVLCYVTVVWMPLKNQTVDRDLAVW